MKTLSAGLLGVVFAGACWAASPFDGHWDITVPGDQRARAWWLEVDGDHGKFVGAPGGQLDEVSHLTTNQGELRFEFHRNYRRGGQQGPDQTGVYTARLDGQTLHGVFEVEGQPGSRLEWTGVRAPELSGKDDGTWKRGAAVALFNGKDVSGWHSRLPNRPLAWSVRGGLLANSKGAPDLVSDSRFRNFDLHVEYRIGEHSNSGIGLRGRYEVQIYDDYGQPPSAHGNGAIYSRIAPTVNASKRPGEWQTFDIRLIGREVSVALNGTKIIDHKIIEGLTAIANDANENDPGPLILQGDHGPVEFRQVVIYPLEQR